jgi:AcrR family transcriptional regulator
MRKESFKERQRRQREVEIIAEAGQMIRQHGLGALNMDSLAEVVGVSKPTLYQHFKSKEELIARILLDGIKELEQYLLSTTQNPPMERLTNTLRMLLEKRYGNHGLATGVSSELVFMTLHSHEDVVAAKKRVRALVDGVVEEGKASGDIDSSIPTALVSCTIFTLMRLPAAAEMEDDIDTVINHVVYIFTRSVQHHP